MIIGSRPRRALVLALALVATPTPAFAQELEPGLYHAAPIGLNAATTSYTFSTGNILLDATLPIEGAHADLNTVGLGYVRTMGLFGRTAKVDLQTPIGWGTFDGYVGGVYRVRKPSGFADPRLRLAVNLIGAPALRRAEFAAKHRPGTILGVSLQVVAPLGQYDAERLINLGSNRWSFRPELGLSSARGRWFVEMATGAWLFTQNPHFYGDVTLSQEPLLFVKGDVIYTFKRNTWLAANYGVATGGETSTNGGAYKDLQTNHRMGATLALPVRGAFVFKATYTSGLTTRLGADFDSYGAALQYSWGK